MDSWTGGYRKTVLKGRNDLKLGIIKWRLAHYLEVAESTDLIFAMQGSLMCLVEALEFLNTQRLEASCSFTIKN